MRKIPYGEANFEVIRNEDLLYVDKTMYIEKLDRENLKRYAIVFIGFDEAFVEEI